MLRGQREREKGLKLTVQITSTHFSPNFQAPRLIDYRIFSIKHRGRLFQTRPCKHDVYSNPAYIY